MTILGDMTARAQGIHHTLINELRQIDGFRDDMMSEKAIELTKAESAAAARSRAQAEITDLRTQAAELRKRAEEAIAPHLRPGRSTRDDWQRVEMLIQSGRGLSDIIADADVNQLQAIVEWAPTWLRAQAKPTSDTTPEMYETAVRNDVLTRWAQISDTDLFSNALSTFDAVSAVERVGSATALIIAGRTPTAHDVMAAGYAAPARMSLTDIAS